jgi:hypothetical protein
VYNVDWSKISYDLSGVDWSSVFAPKSTPTPSPSSSSVKVEAAPTSSAAPAYTPKPQPTSEEAPEPTETKQPDNKPGNIVNDIMSGVESLIKKIGICSAGENSETDNGKIWLGDSSKWTVTFVNAADSDVTVFCWPDAGFTGMTLNVNKPLISAALKPGASQVVSWAGGFSSACAPVYKDTELAMFGGIKNTWFEITPPDGSVGSGCFDVSRNVFMNGNSISAQGSKCKSDMDTCVFHCKNTAAESCISDYDLFNCNAGNGGGGGYDSVMGGTGGGCSMDADSENITVTFS